MPRTRNRLPGGKPQPQLRNPTDDPLLGWHHLVEKARKIQRPKGRRGGRVR